MFPQKGLDLEEVIQIIHNSGGKVVLVHLSCMRVKEDFWSYLGGIKNIGIDGIEAHSLHNTNCNELKNYWVMD